jgi:hypothetical protein
MNLGRIGCRAVFKHHCFEIMAKSVHNRRQNTEVGGNSADGAKGYIACMQPWGRLQKKICLIPPGRDQADYVSETAVIIFGANTSGTGYFSGLNSNQMDLRIQAVWLVNFIK